MIFKEAEKMLDTTALKLGDHVWRVTTSWDDSIVEKLQVIKVGPQTLIIADIGTKYGERYYHNQDDLFATRRDALLKAHERTIGWVETHMKHVQTEKAKLAEIEKQISKES